MHRPPDMPPQRDGIDTALGILKQADSARSFKPVRCDPAKQHGHHNNLESEIQAPDAVVFAAPTMIRRLWFQGVCRHKVAGHRIRHRHPRLRGHVNVRRGGVSICIMTQMDRWVEAQRGRSGLSRPTRVDPRGR